MSKHQRAHHLQANMNPTGRLREQLTAQMTRYERELEHLKQAEDIDFSLMQTYRELIHARKDMLRQLPPTF
ncbi:hypothetical protein [Marinimicrobium alkaliphilum]|uniref:hypothetical protein n=1 Tax=Marinimicrobium alkaliphilum TaxID=2202654 RepID=UPI000DB9BF30|nr:hypothetical protein [Marinimicrobium alkaliphilum]